MAIDIVPALLVRHKHLLEEGLIKLHGVSPWVQVDLVDRNYLLGEETFPQWKEFNFEVDLMTDDQMRDAEAAVALGAARVVVHAHRDALKALEVLQKYRAGDFPVEVGIALHPDDAPDTLATFAGLYDYVQVMGIAQEGSQGEPADERAVALVRALRAAHPELLIQVDGAVAERVSELVRAGATRLIVGGAIANADNPKAVYKSLYTEANGAERQEN